MTELRLDRVESDADLADLAAIRTAVARPWESGPEVAFLRHHLDISPAYRLFVARLDGKPVGCGSAGSSVPGDPTEELPVQADVLPACRRRGIGTALLREASAYARSLGCTALVTEVYEDDAEKLAFVARRGFAEIERQKAVALELDGAEPPEPETPPGVEIVSRAERDGLERGMYAAGLEAGRDIPGRDGEHEPTFEQWRDFEIGRPSRDPRLSFVALAERRRLDGAAHEGGAGSAGAPREELEVAGFASVDVIGGVGYNGLTAVRRAYRRRGIPRALKLHQIAAAKALGLPRLVTESEERNEPMRRLNESLGYRPVPGMVVLQGPLLD